MYDRLPTPFGLVRGGVAPDHQKIKSVTRVYDKIAAHPEFRFYGNVEMGRDVTHADLQAYYHAIIYAVGARTDRRMGIPREYLPGSHSATEFVGWYNAHPDFRHLGFDLQSETAAVVGNGNVAMDLARILASPKDVLAQTDIAEHALEELAEQPHPGDPRPRPPRPRPGGVHQQGAEGARRAARGRRGRQPAGGGPRPPQRRVGGPQPEPHPRPQPRDPAGVRRPASRRGRRCGSTCTSWCRRWRSSAASGWRASPSSTTSCTSRRTAPSGPAPPTGAPPSRWGWCSGRSATRGCRSPGSRSTRCAA